MRTSKLHPVGRYLTATLISVFPALTLAAESIDTIEIIGKKLDDARNGLSTDTGSSIYRFDQSDIANLPLGDSTPLNQIILQAPGVVQDSFGQLHVRGDHSNLQYRINGVVIPESISGFGQALDSRFASQINIFTGALPAQYGYRTAGIVDIQGKGSDYGNGGTFSLLGGGNDHRELGVEVGVTSGKLNYFLTGSTLRNDIGIENPTASRSAIHDDTQQSKGFGSFSWLIDNDSRASFMFGVSNNRFQIPNTANLVADFQLAGVSKILSQNLDANQRERNQFEVLSYQSIFNAKTDFQLSLFHRDTDVAYRPDAVGDLVFNGVAATVLRQNVALGVQADASFHVNRAHTLRSGVFFQQERFSTDNQSRVFPADANGAQTSTTPITIVDNSNLLGKLAGVYVQDEWQAMQGLTVNYGARYDKVNTIVNENQLSPRLGLVLEITPETRIHAGFARYFTPPPTEKIDSTSIKKFQGTTNALPSDANTAVKSERSDYYDIGFASQISKHLTVGIDAYYRNVEHLQDEGQFGKALIFSAFNFAKGKIRGAEFSMSYREDKFSAYANISTTKAEGTKVETGQFNFDDDELAYINSHWVHLDHEQTLAGSAGFSYRMNETTLSADMIYGSGLRRGFANTEHLPGYTQVNAAVANTFAFAELGKFEGRLSIINLFDKSYQLRDGSGIGVGAPQFAQRRTLYAGLSKSF